MRISRLFALAVPACLLVAAASCGDGGPTTSAARPGLQVLPTPGQDTVGATQFEAVMVAARDQGGSPVAGAQVRFAVVDAEPLISIGEGGTPPAATVQVMTTDATGRAWVAVRAGHRAGTAHVEMSTAGMQPVTATFTVLPGAGVSVSLTPTDTAVYVGSSFPVTAVAADRYGNPRSEQLELLHAGPVDVQGRNGVGVAIGRGAVVVSYGGRYTYGRVSVVPPGVIAAYEQPLVHEGPNGQVIDQPGRMVTLNTDGSDYRVAATENPPVVSRSGAGMQPSWSATGGELTFLNAGSLMRLSAAGVARTVVPGLTDVNTEYPTVTSRDGQWIYFTRGPFGSRQTPWRVHPDGSGLEQVGEQYNEGQDAAPSPSPAGDRVVFQTNHVTNSPFFTLRIANLATGDHTDLPPAYAFLPRWSPSGDWIAYLGEKNMLRRIHPDGTGDQEIGIGYSTNSPFAWSPDGEWIVFVGENGLSLLRLLTGEVLPIAHVHHLTQPSWKP